MIERSSGAGAARGAAPVLAAAALSIVTACGEPDTAAALEGDAPGAAAVPDSAILVRHAPSPPVIDGEVDPIWDESAARPVRVPVVGSTSGDADLSGHFRVLHDDRALYVLFTVTDDLPRSDSPLPFEDDAVELYVDGGYERVRWFDRNDWQFVFGRDGTVWVTAGQISLHPELELAAAETEDGYRIEAAIPWEGIGVRPEDGAAIGLEARIDDDDDGDGVDAVLAWHAAGPSYEDASVLGAGVLGGANAAGHPTAIAPAPSPTPGVGGPLAMRSDTLAPIADAAPQDALNALSDRERHAGFDLLFDGETLEHWKGYRSDSIPGDWRVEDGLLALDAVGEESSIVSRERYADFELTLEWMISEGGNSGIFYRVTEDRDQPWETGPEMQVLDDERHSDGRVPEWSAGGTYGLHAPAAKVVLPPGEWNRVRILVDADHVTYWLNDVKVVEYRLWSDDWEALVASTKFARMPDYGRAREGHIVLQDHGNPVWFRNIKIRRLPERAGAGAEGLRVLVFTDARGHDHGTDGAAVEALRALATEHGFVVDATDDGGAFTAEGLARYDAVVFLNTTGDVLSDPEQAAFEAYIRAGGGFVGVHSATDTEYDWAWYGGLVGAYFADHPAVQPARLWVTDPSQPSTRHLPLAWIRTDEWYDFRDGPGEDVTVLLELDESSYRGGGMGDRHPIAWQHAYDGGRAFYTGIGHRPEAFSDPLFVRHLMGGIIWAAGEESDDG